VGFFILNKINGDTITKDTATRKRGEKGDEEKI